MISCFLIIQVPDTSDQRSMSFAFSPFDGFVLRLEGFEHVICVVFNDIIGDRLPLKTTLGARFNIDVGHGFSP
jgi:hypothetical protein